MSDTNDNGSADTPAEGAAATPRKRKTAPKPAATEAATTPNAEAVASEPAGPNGAEESEENSRLRATLQAIEARAQELRRWGMARQETAREVVEEHPLTIVGAAFGVGLLIGLLSSRI